MSTRAIVGTPTGPDLSRYRGVYVHSDGHPKSLGKTLHQMCRVHFGSNGTQLVDYMIDQHPEGWSAVGGDVAGPSQWRDILSMSRDEQQVANISYQGRPGVRNNGFLNEQSDAGQMWTYLITDTDLIVIHGTSQNGDTVATVPFSRSTDTVDWAAIQYGHDLGRATSQTWVHFPEIDGPAGKVPVDEFLGRHPMDVRSAIAMEINGARWEVTGSYSMLGTDDGDLQLTMTLIDPDGIRRKVDVGRVDPQTSQITALAKNISPVFAATYEERYGRPFTTISDHRRMFAA